MSGVEAGGRHVVATGGGGFSLVERVDGRVAETRLPSRFHGG